MSCFALALAWMVLGFASDKAFYWSMGAAWDLLGVGMLWRALHARHVGVPEPGAGDRPMTPG